MSSNTLSILKDLCLTPAPSGFEAEIAEKIHNYLSSYCQSVTKDNVGNIIGIIRGKDPSLKPLMINAHMDRVGFIVSTITAEGFIKLKKIGTPNEKVLPGLSLRLRTYDGSEWISGVVGTKCAHLLSPDERVKMEPISNMLIDIGADSAEAVKALGIKIGCPCVYEPHFSIMNNGRINATALDNCGCCAALIDIASHLSKNKPLRDTYIVANVWEEHNQQGAAFCARNINPIADISLDMLLAGDTPDTFGYVNGKVGSGPMLSCFNFCDTVFNGTIAHEGLLALAEETGVRNGIATQRYVCDGSLGDNANNQLQGDGPAVIEIGAAVRYAHSSSEVADIHDIEQVGELVAKLALRIDADFKQARF